MQEILKTPPIYEQTPESELDVQLASKAPKIAEKAIAQVRSLTEQMEDAKRALAEGCETWRKDVLDWTTHTLPKTLEEIRLARMTLTTEVSTVQRSLNDLRKFFIGPDYELETARLKEFVDLCERLQKLKESGFLDAVSDTMIRLAVQETRP